MDNDVIIIGGSYAGISAALQLARARRKVLVIDAGERRNRFATRAHGFLGQDGRDPGDIAARARAQLMRYDTVRWLEGKVTSARRQGDGFAVAFDAETSTSRRLILATGVVDVPPDIAGLRERWGKSVFHCPYCNGYELNQGRIGVIASSEHAMHHALMLPDWGSTTLFTNAAFVPDEAQLQQLKARGTAVETTPIAEIAGHADVLLADGRRCVMNGLFAMPRTTVWAGWASDLGCAVEAGPTGEFIATNPMKETSVKGVFACGDVARAAGNLALAVGDGAMAGAATHRSLMFETI